MGVSMLKMDRAKAKWRVKLQRAFAGHSEHSASLCGADMRLALTFGTP